MQRRATALMMMARFDGAKKENDIFSIISKDIGGTTNPTAHIEYR
jgi:hypothetical protein